MTNRFLPLLLVFIALLFPRQEAKAQDVMVVAVCGTLPLAYAPGATRLQTVDVNGRLCTSGVTSGVTPTNCTTTQVLFALAGKVACDAGFTYAGSGGAITVAGALTANSLNAVSSINISGGAFQVFNNGAIFAASLQAFGAAPTATAGTCVGGAVTGAPAAGIFTAPVCAGGTIILTFAAGLVTNGWVCDIKDRTTPADAINQTASTATTATFTATTAVNDVLQFKCTGY